MNNASPIWRWFVGLVLSLVLYLAVFVTALSMFVARAEASLQVGDYKSQDTKPATYSSASDACSAWRPVDVSQPGVIAGPPALYGISALASNDIWVVGTRNDLTVERTLIEHWNGNTWSIVPSPDAVQANYSVNILTAVDARAANDVWAVGYYGETSNGGNNYRYALILHWDGVAWTLVPGPTQESQSTYLQGVVALSADNAWAVGWSSSANSSQPYITHWNGTSWSAVSVPGSSPTGSTAEGYLNAIAAISSTDIWAVGSDTGSSNPFHSLILHWNGVQWSVVPSPDNEPFSSDLYGLAAVSATDVWAVGGGGGTGLVEHWNGSVWSVVASPRPFGTYNSLRAVAAVSANDVWAVGERFEEEHYDTKTLVQHWDGSAWHLVTSPDFIDEDHNFNSNSLMAISALSSSDVWAAGSYRTSSTGQKELVLHYSTGVCPTATPIPTGTSTPTMPPTPIVGCGIEFADVPPGYTFYPYASCLTCKESIGGYGCGGTDPWTGVPEPCDEDNKPYFRPSNPVSRGQIAKMVSQSAGFNEPAGEQIYEDVPPGSTFYDFVQRLSHRDVMGGYPCGQPDTEPCIGPTNRPNFRPDALATRGQISKIVSNAAGFEDEPTSQKFEDVPPANPFYLWVERLGSRDVMGGYPCDTVPEEPCVEPSDRPYFRYGRTVTRGQASKIVANTFFPGCEQPTPTPTATATLQATTTATATVTPGTGQKVR